MLYKMSENFNATTNQPLSLAEQMRTYIDKKLRQNLSTSDVAKHFHVSPIYASRIFKSAYEQTINQYIISSTMEMAEQWLNNSNCSIREIAETLGFCNEKYFSTQFKKIYGISPKQYQLKHNKKVLCNVPVEADKIE